MTEKRCDSCARKRGDKCATLKEMIGKYRDCPFWTDDPEWEIKAEDAIKAYGRTRSR